MVRRLVAILVGASVLVGAACGDDDDTAADDSPPSTDEPGVPSDGGDVNPFGVRTFIGTEVTEGGQPRPLVEDTELAIDFGPDDQIGVTAGCNSMSGTAEIGEDTLKAAAGLATTEMGCDPARHAQDEWIADLLVQGFSYTLAGDELQLTSGDTVITLLDRETVNPDRPLEATVWQLDGIVEGDGVSSVPQGASATVVFQGGEVVVTNEGCNGARGPAEITESEITIGGLMMTKMGCEPAPTTVETALTRVLDGTITYRIEATRLDLTNPNGTALTLVASE